MANSPYSNQKNNKDNKTSPSFANNNVTPTRNINNLYPKPINNAPLPTRNINNLYPKPIINNPVPPSNINNAHPRPMSNNQVPPSNVNVFYPRRVNNAPLVMLPPTPIQPPIVNPVNTNYNQNNNNNNNNNNNSNSDRNNSLFPEEKPWYKRKLGILTLFTSVALVALPVAIVVPLVLFNVNTPSSFELKEVAVFYDLETNNVKLVLKGKNLPDKKEIYSVNRVTNTRAFIPIDWEIMKLVYVSGSEVHLDFLDANLTMYSIYQVKLKNGSKSDVELVSEPGKNNRQPKISITRQPLSQTLLTSSLDTVINFSIDATIDSPIPPPSIAAPTYQWEEANIANGPYSKIPNATSSIYNYSARDLKVNTRKWFRCNIIYPYANPINSTPAYVEKLDRPVITIGRQPSNVNLTLDQTNAQISVIAASSNPKEQLTYQWQSATAEDGTFSNIKDETKNTYDLPNVAYGFKKFYKCKISSPNSGTVDSSIVYISKVVQPVIEINSQPASVNAAFAETNATLSVSASILHGVSGQRLTFQWQISDNESSGFTNINGATTPTYNYASIQNITAGSKKYFRCVISSTYATTVNSNVAHIMRGLQPTITINTQPIPQTLTSASNNFTLTIGATVANPISGLANPTYQWESSDTQNGKYTPIVNATNHTYTKELDANKNSLRDKWYRCVINYQHAAPKTSTPVLVKMTLTQDEAKAELIKWFSIRSNYEPILTNYFNGTNATNGRQNYYTSLHLNEFVKKPNTVEMFSITQEEFVSPTTNITVPRFTSYKIRLKTTDSATYRPKTANGTGTLKDIPSGSHIEFNTLFSFVGNSSLVGNVFSPPTPNCELVFEPTFSIHEGSNLTSIRWKDVSGNPSMTLLSRGYPVRITDSTGNKIIEDSILNLTRPNPDFNSINTPTIPTYNIR